MIAHGNQLTDALFLVSPKDNFVNLGNTDSQSILQRVATGERQAAGECLDCYGSLVWNLAKQHTNSNAETERMVRVIFLDIWKNAKGFDAEKFDEHAFITVVALRRLLKNKEQAKIV